MKSPLQIGLLWAILLAGVVGTLRNASRSFAVPSPEIRPGEFITLPPGTRSISQGGLLVVLGEECPACIEFVEGFEGILSNSGLNADLVHVVIVAGRRGRSSLEPLLPGRVSVTLDSRGTWAENNGFLFGPIVASLNPGGQVDRLFAWNTHRKLVPYAPHTSSSLDSVSSPVLKKEVQRWTRTREP
jgi:hypothetical protein